MEYKLHQIQWDDEKVKRFWDFYNNYQAFEELWFSKTVGREIIQFVNKFQPIKGNVLDYGIGKGHLANYLMEDANVSLYACDFSAETVLNINNQFSERNNFKGCFLVKGFPSDFEENKFEFVFLIEAIEHLTDDYLIPTLEEIKRILKPGGIVVITTPNDENLDLQHVSCPDCGCIYHRVQHVRSFNKDNLADLMRKKSFKTLYCNAVNFEERKKSLVVRNVKNIVHRLLGSKHKNPHLVFIGKKN